MSETEDLINANDLKAPLVLLKNLEALIPVLTKIIQLGMDREKSIASSNSTTKLKDQTKLLAKEQEKLAAVQQTIAKEFIKTNQQLTAQTTQTTKLNQALKTSQVNYGALRTEQARNTKEGKDLLTTIQKQDAEFKKLNQDLKNNEFNNATISMKSLKLELKAAKDEMADAADKFGEGSEQFKKAALRAGEAKDKIGDMAEATKAVSGEPLEKLSGSFGLIVNKLKALDFKGALGGVKQFTAASKELTFKQATQGLGQFVKGLGQMGKALLTNPLFLLVAVIVGIVTAIILLRDKIKPLKIAFDFVGDAIGYVVKKGKDFLDWLGLTTFALDEKTAKTIENAKKERDAITKRYEDEIKLAQAAGKQTFDQEKKKQEAIMSTTQAAIDAYAARLAGGGTKLSDEEIKDLEELKVAYKDAALELKIIAIQKAKFEDDARKKKIADEQAFQKELIDMAHKAAESILSDTKSKDDEYIAAHRKRVLEVLSVEGKTELERRKILSDSDDIIEGHKKASTKRLVEDEIKALTAIIPFVQMNAEEKAKVEQKLADLKNQLITIDYDNFKTNEEQKLADTQNYLTQTQDLYNGFTTGLGGLFSDFTESRLAGIQKEQDALQNALNTELQMAGDNEAAKADLKNEFALKNQALENKRIQQQRRSAIFDKATSVIGAAINTALAVTNQLAKGDPYTAIPRAIAAGVIGALQVAAIVAKPIPQYEEGTKGIPHKGGPAIVGEAGHEMVVVGNKMSLTPDKPTLMNLPAGAQVIPNNQLGAIAMAGLKVSDTVSSNPENEVYNMLNLKLGSLEQTVKNKKEFHINFTREGAEALMRNGESRIKFLNDFFH